VLPRRPGPLGSALDITTILMNVSLGLAQMLMLTYRGQGLVVVEDGPRLEQEVRTLALLSVDGTGRGESHGQSWISCHSSERGRVERDMAVREQGIERGETRLRGVAAQR
jgi:hypothetical protein